MKQSQAIHALDRFARENRVVFTLADLGKVFGETGQTRQATLRRLVGSGVVARAARGVYVYLLDTTPRPHLIESLAMTLRRGHYNYISLESALSEYAVISQIPIDRLTVMTTGRSAEYRTPWGVIEFTHTKRDIAGILEGTFVRDQRLRFATVETAWRDLKRVGRNIHLVDLHELSDRLRG